MFHRRKMKAASKRGLLQKFQETLAANKLWTSREKILLGVSGGPDSVALLHLLCVTGHRPVVVHVNHLLRGPQSNGDERFVHGLCRKWGCCFEGARLETDQWSKKLSQSLEEAARILRYDFFYQIAREHRAKKVLVAHTKNDQAETFLLRLLRGTGRRGLGGMKMISPLPVAEAGAKPCKVQLVRPLLRVSRPEILAYLRQNRLVSREDGSNRDEKFLRNRVRRKLIPLLQKEFQPAVVDLLCRTAEILAEEDRLLEKHVPFLGRGRRIHASKILRLSEGLRQRALLKWLEFQGCATPSWERLDSVLRAMVSHSKAQKRIQLPEGKELVLKQEMLSLVKNHC